MEMLADPGRPVNYIVDAVKSCTHAVKTYTIRDLVMIHYVGITARRDMEPDQVVK